MQMTHFLPFTITLCMFDASIHQACYIILNGIFVQEPHMPEPDLVLL